MTGRSIRIHLADGTPKGVRVAQSPVRTCIVVVAPTAELGSLPELVEYVRGPGVYFLVGEDPDSVGRQRVYVGESENVLERVRGHLQEGGKDFQQAVFVLSTSDFLTKAHITWLEKRFIQILNDAGVATVENGNAGRKGSLPRADQDDLETFLVDARMMLPVLGFDFAREPLAYPRPQGDEVADSPVFEYSRAGARATMQIQDGEYVVFEGSTARVEGAPSWDSYKKYRSQLVEDGVLVPSDDPDFYVFPKSFAFRSPSAAASCVGALAEPGPVAWKVRETGETLKEWLARQAGSDNEDGEQE